MALYLSNKIMVIMAIALCASNAMANSYVCEEVEITSLMVTQKEVSTLCFLKKSQNYFLSNNCLTLKCAFLARAKDMKFSSNEKERPGRTMCKALGGAVEKITIKDKGEHFRCVSPDQHSSISLNLLESWNGKVFSGPGDKDYSF